MSEITAGLVKQLRDKTGLGMMTCKEALAATAGDVEKAIEYLRKKGLDAAGKRAGRKTGEGLIGSYIHVTGKIGVMVEVNCESDFVARGDDFRQLAKDICMHVAATDPIAVSADDVSAAVVERARWKYRQRAYRYMYMDAGHIGQNVALAAEGLGLGCCAIGSIYDDEVNDLVGADGIEETAVYLTCVGQYKR